MNNEFYVSTDKSRLDIDLIHKYLSTESYWAKGRSLDVVKRSIDNSLCFGVYKDDKLCGFARVVTDYSVFAWIMDVFVLPEYRGLGLGKLLMDSIVSHSELQNLKRWGLATDDAHGLYEQYGFALIKEPQKFMEKVSSPA